jgi:gliding motility-associated-like protein
LSIRQKIRSVSILISRIPQSLRRGILLIKDLENNPVARFRVYDRFGLLVTQFKALEQGWKGFYKNRKKSLPNSYWFKVNFLFKEALRDFHAYFSLERN